MTTRSVQFIILGGCLARQGAKSLNTCDRRCAMKTVCVHAACLLGLFFLLLFWGGNRVCPHNQSAPNSLWRAEGRVYNKASDEEKTKQFVLMEKFQQCSNWRKVDAAEASKSKPSILLYTGCSLSWKEQHFRLVCKSKQG